MAPSCAATSVPVETTLNSLMFSLIADETVDEGDLVGAGLLVPLKKFCLIRPGLEAAGIGARPGDDLGACPSADRG